MVPHYVFMENTAQDRRKVTIGLYKIFRVRRKGSVHPEASGKIIDAKDSNILVSIVSSLLPPLSLSMKTYKALPLNLLSRVWGCLASVPLPKPLDSASIWCFIQIVGCDRFVVVSLATL